MATKRTTKKAETAAAKAAAKETEVVSAAGKTPVTKTVAEEAKEVSVKAAETVVKAVEEAAKPVLKKVAAPKKTVAEKKTAAEKETVKKVAVYVQFMGKEMLTEDIVADIKKAWAGSNGKKEEDIKDLQVYIKPEESKAYYVVNGKADGSYIAL